LSLPSPGENKVKLYYLTVPAHLRLPVVASLPHSGTYVPRRIFGQFRKDPPPVLSPMDWHLEELYRFLLALGITMIQATHSRYVVNLNRALAPPLFGPERESIVSRSNCFGGPLYDGELSQEKVEERIEKYYQPYHRRLESILRKTVKDYGRAYLLDLHSYYKGPEVDVCLGDVNGTTCSELLTGCFERAFYRQGFNVTRNEVWLGGHITRHYGAMANVEALQIELHFPAYLEGEAFEEDEAPGYDSEKFRGVQERIRRVFIAALDELLGRYV
jgi:N-formylglutamate deformylase